MSFSVFNTAHASTAKQIAMVFEESAPQDQADLFNEIGSMLDAHHEDQRMAGYAKDMALFLEQDGKAFILALAAAIQNNT